ncbi:MAG: S-methyl-5'-thioadenosine phosphorylase [Bdellovibrionota bacterium]
MLGIIGGTGLYKLDQLKVLETREAKTPYGSPSAPLVIGELGRNRVAFLPRHGTSHELLPSEINFRANIFALKEAGARALVGVSAVGSLKIEVKPADLALPDQYIDFTRGQRTSTFFGKGVAAHVSTANPVCSILSGLIVESAKSQGIALHGGLTYACVEGPRLGTRAESHFFRLAGCGLVGMTNVPEVYLAREAQLPYATLCIATDYDCWLDDPTQHAQVDKIMELYGKNIERVKSILVALCERDLGVLEKSEARQALKYSLLTPRERLTPEQKTWLATLEL